MICTSYYIIRILYNIVYGSILWFILKCVSTRTWNILCMLCIYIYHYYITCLYIWWPYRRRYYCLALCDAYYNVNNVSIHVGFSPARAGSLAKKNSSPQRCSHPWVCVYTRVCVSCVCINLPILSDLYTLTHAHTHVILFDIIIFGLIEPANSRSRVTPGRHE